MSRLLGLDLNGEIPVINLKHLLIWMAGQEMDDEGFLFVAEGLTTLSMLETLNLSGYCCSRPSFC
jgi:hypothetical protein